MLQIVPLNCVVPTQCMVFRKSDADTFAPDGQSPLIPSRIAVYDERDIDCMTGEARDEVFA